VATYIIKTPEPCSVKIFSIAETETEAVAIGIKWLDEHGVGSFDPRDLLVRKEQ
jgi:hypothetical protein